MKEEKKKKKEKQSHYNEDDEHEEGSDSEIPRSNRSSKRLNLYGDSPLYTNSFNNNNHKNGSNEVEDEDEFLVQKRDTPRLPPIQRPIGTKFNEESPVRKLKKKKKKPKLKALKENLEEDNPDAVEKEISNSRATSGEWMDDQREGNLSMFQKESMNSLSNIEVNAISSFRRAQNEYTNGGYSMESLEEEEGKKSRKKKKKGSKKKLKEEEMVNGYGHDLTTPRTLAGEEGTDDDLTPRRERLRRANAMEGQGNLIYNLYVIVHIFV